MKLLLVNAIDPARSSEAACPALGLAYLAAALKRRLPQVRVRITDRDLPDALAAFAPDAVGISSVSQNFGRASEMAAACRAAGIPVFAGGVHISLLPGSLPREFDFGVVGEGEETITEVAELLLSDPRLKDPARLEKIRGLVVHSAAGPRLTQPRPPVKDLDSIAPPDRSLLDIRRGGTAHLFTSRGCPYSCAFCASSRFWGGFRPFSPEYVAAEAGSIVEACRPRTLSFYDDLLAADLPRLARLVGLLRAAGLHERVRFTFFCRADLVSEELLRIISPLKVLMVGVGLESASAKNLEYLKAGASPERNRRALELLAGAGIDVQGTFVLGSPGETEAELLQTLDFIKTSRLALFNAYTLTPFPGTPVWDAALAAGLVSERMDWARLASDQEELTERRLLLTGIPRARFAELYGLFLRERKKRLLKYALRTGLRAPLLAAAELAAAARRRSAKIWT